MKKILMAMVVMLVTWGLFVSAFETESDKRFRKIMEDSDRATAKFEMACRIVDMERSMAKLSKLIREDYYKRRNEEIKKISPTMSLEEQMEILLEGYCPDCSCVYNEDITISEVMEKFDQSSEGTTQVSAGTPVDVVPVVKPEDKFVSILSLGSLKGDFSKVDYLMDDMDLVIGKAKAENIIDSALEVEEVTGVKLGILRISSKLDRSQILKKIKKLKKKGAEALIVSVRWEDLTTKTPSNSQKKLAKWLIKKGASVVIGINKKYQSMKFVEASNGNQGIVIYSQGKSFFRIELRKNSLSQKINIETIQYVPLVQEGQEWLSINELQENDLVIEKIEKAKKLIGPEYFVYADPPEEG